MTTKVVIARHFTHKFHTSSTLSAEADLTSMPSVTVWLKWMGVCVDLFHGGMPEAGRLLDKTVNKQTLVE